MSAHSSPKDPDVHKGAVEGDRPDDAQQANSNAPALDEEGLPADPIAIAEDRIGANVDHKDVVASANEAGQSAGSPGDEDESAE